MRTLAIIFKDPYVAYNDIDHKIKFVLKPSVKQVILIFAETQRWYIVNDPNSIINSSKQINMEAYNRRNRITSFLEKFENSVNIFNPKIEITKLVIYGDEKYKIVGCIRLLNIDMVAIWYKSVKSLLNFFTVTLDEYIVNELRIPVLMIPMDESKVDSS